MSDESFLSDDTLSDNQLDFVKENEKECWFDNESKEVADDEEEEEGSAEDEKYEKELLGEDDESNFACSQNSGFSSETVSDIENDVTFSPRSDMLEASSSSNGSMSSCVSSKSTISDDDCGSMLHEEAGGKRRISLDESEDENVGCKKTRMHENLHELSNSDSDVPPLQNRKRRLGSVIPLPSSSSSSCDM